MRIRPAVDTRLGEANLRNKKSMLKLFQFWMIHGTWGFVCSLPVTLLNAKAYSDIQKESGTHWMQHLAMFVWFLGFVIEAVADYTKLRNYNQNSSEMKDRSKMPTYYNMNNHVLWKYSRHPNFLGECMCWLGLGCAAALEFYPDSSLNPFNSIDVNFFLCLLSPIFTFGIMLGEAVLWTEWKNNFRFRKENFIVRSEYEEYKKRTSLLIPFPPQLYIMLPKIVRKYVFFELDIYEKARNPNWLKASSKEESLKSR